MNDSASVMHFTGTWVPSHHGEQLIYRFILRGPTGAIVNEHSGWMISQGPAGSGWALTQYGLQDIDHGLFPTAALAKEKASVLMLSKEEFHNRKRQLAESAEVLNLDDEAERAVNDAAMGRVLGHLPLEFDGDALLQTTLGQPPLFGRFEKDEGKEQYCLVFRNSEGEALAPTAVYIAKPYPDNRSWSLIKHTGTGISTTEDKIGLFTPEAWEFLRQATYRYPPAL